MLVVRVTENVRAVQSSYYSSCPWPSKRTNRLALPYTSRTTVMLSFLNKSRHQGLYVPHKCELCLCDMWNGFFFWFFFPLEYTVLLLSYRAGLLLQRWQHVLIQAASSLWASHPFPHSTHSNPVCPWLCSTQTYWQISGLDGATATCHRGGDSNIIVCDNVELQDPEHQLDG
jgi:hypothetical protein